MKIRNITAAVMLGLGTVSSPILIGQAQAADMETQAIADQVKAGIAKWDKINSQAYQRFIAAQNPNIKSISFTTGDYQSTDTGATATGKISVVLNPDAVEEGGPSEIVLTLKDNILYGDELMAEDILARIESQLVLTDDLEKVLNQYDIISDKEDAAKLKKALEYLDITVDLHPDGSVNHTAQVRPFEFEESGDKVKFDGLTIHSNYHESTAADGVGELKLEFGQFTSGGREDAGEAEAAQENIFTILPFSMEYALEEDGDLKLTGTPFKIEYSEDNTVFTIESIKAEGDDVHFNDELGTFTGKQEFVLDNIQFNNDSMPSPLVFDSVRINSEVEKDDDLYDFGTEIKIDVDGESINKLTGMTGFEVEDAGIKMEFEDVSALTVQAANYQLPALLEQGDEEKIQTVLQTIISEMAQNQSELKTEVAFNTDQGDATFVSDIKAKSDAVTDTAQWQAAFESSEPTAFINLLQKSFDFDVKVTVPDSLVKATGMEGMMAMAAGYVVKDGSDYVLHLENSDDGIKLNGNVMPLGAQ